MEGGVSRDLRISECGFITLNLGAYVHVVLLLAAVAAGASSGIRPEIRLHCLNLSRA